MHCLGSVICFRGAKCGKEEFFSVECCLLAFNIVALGLVVRLELFVSRVYVASYYANHIYPILGDPGATSQDDAINIFGRKFTSRAEEPLGTYSYRTSSRSGRILNFLPNQR